jgi:predicted metal-dependent peptidase
MISDELWLEIGMALEIHHAVFYKVWQLGKPSFTKEIDTAAIKFDKEGKYFLFLFNPEFWNSLDFYNKLFIICHECLHVILNHGVRIKDANNYLLVNQALDIVVNHLLIDKFSFKREKIKNWQDFCWVDTVFQDKNIATNENYEFYFNLLKKNYGDGYPLLKLVDDHNFETIEDKNLFDHFSSEEKSCLLDALEKHFEVDKWFVFNNLQINKKRKWETIIKNWSFSMLEKGHKDAEQWTRLNRRFSMLSKEIFIPSEMEIEEIEKQKNKIEVCFFLDTSGSCWDLKERFFSAAESLPKKKFNINLFCFDTKIQKTTLESKRIYGGGGTSFTIIEQFIQSMNKHPDGVFVITDGYGDYVNPKSPKNWHWFLTEESTSSFISKKCNIYKLSEFE